MISAVSTIDNLSKVFTDFLSEPKIIGIGPTIITPADLTLLPLLRRTPTVTVAAIKTTIPTKTSMKPNKNNVEESAIAIITI